MLDAVPEAVEPLAGGLLVAELAELAELRGWSTEPEKEHPATAATRKAVIAERSTAQRAAEEVMVPT